MLMYAAMLMVGFVYLVLSNIYFGENRDGPVWIAVNYVLYYAGQYLIASSVLWIGKTF